MVVVLRNHVAYNIDMARNTSPKWKRYRRLGVPIPGKGASRNYPPGQHGNKRRARLTEYGLQLREKQKAKLFYGLMEKQFRNYFLKASTKDGNTGDLLMQSLESRLDNAVYRAGFAETREQARQLVTHGHFMVNGRGCNVPSREMVSGDTVTLKVKSIKNNYFTQLPSTMKMHQAPSWMEVDKEKLEISIKTKPAITDAEQDIAVNMIVEFYSR